MSGANVPTAQAPAFVAVGRKYGIPPAVLAGIADVESNFSTSRSEVSSTGAQGEMQFEPGTAAGLGVDPWNFQSALDGTARLLIQNGYKQNPTRAIAAYNAGMGNYTAGLGYASQVLSDASRLAPQLAGVGPGLATIPSAAGSSAVASAAGGPAAYGGLSGFLLKAVLTAGFVSAGMFLAIVGTRNTLGAKA